MAERNDAGIAQDQIERHRKKSSDQNLAAEHAMVREDEEKHEPATSQKAISMARQRSWEARLRSSGSCMIIRAGR